VVDASALLKPALADQLGDLAPFRLHAPSLLWSEASAALAQLRFRGEVTADQATEALARILRHPIEVIPSRDLVVRASVIATQLGWAKTYDAEYLALAERLGVRLVTDDARLRASSPSTVAILGPLELLGPG
jgi:predicted nucleic acid-binding protein